jgi:hypothetical protein
MQKKLAMSFLVFFILSMSLASASPTRLYVNPSSVNKAVGTTFTVDVKVEDVANLFAWEFSMKFNQSILECLSVVEGPFLKQYGTRCVGVIVDKTYIDNRLGTILSGCSLSKPDVKVDGSGTFATITFRVKGVGKSTLDLHDTMLIDTNVEDISHEVNDGTFDNIVTTTTVTTVPRRRISTMGIVDAFVQFLKRVFAW